MKYKKKRGFISIEIIIIGCIVIAAGFYAVSSGEKKSASVIKTLDHTVTQVRDTQNGKTYIDDEIAQGEHGDYFYEDGVATKRKITINIYQQNIYRNNSPAKTNMTEYKTTAYTDENFTKTETTYKFIDINQKDWTNDLSYTGFMFAKQEKTDDYEYDVYFHREHYNNYMVDSNISLDTDYGNMYLAWGINLNTGYFSSLGHANTGDTDIIMHNYPLINVKLYIDDVLWTSLDYWQDNTGLMLGDLYYGSTYRVEAEAGAGFELTSSPGTLIINGNSNYYTFAMKTNGNSSNYEFFTVS